MHWSDAAAGMQPLPRLLLRAPAGSTTCDTSRGSSGTPSTVELIGSAWQATEPEITPDTPSGDQPGLCVTVQYKYTVVLTQCRRQETAARYSTGIISPLSPAAGGLRDPLDEVAALHAQFLTPRHLRKGKGGRQPAVSTLLMYTYFTSYDGALVA